MTEPRISIPVDRLAEEAQLAAGKTPIDLIGQALSEAREAMVAASVVARRHGERLAERRTKQFVDEIDDYCAWIAERSVT